jgi:histidine triad (HIT) family protein
VPAEPSCLFCKILAGDVPATVVLETERTYAFRDINATAPTHVLVIPREHIANAAEVMPEHGDIVAEMLVTARQVAEADGVAESGYRLVFNVGKDSGNTVPHLHLHVIGGRGMSWPPG